MSILLDALKKSEAQRQLGQAPDIYSAQGTESSAGRGGRNWLRWALVAVAIVAAAWLGWRYLGPSEAPDGSIADAPQVAVPDTAAEGPAESGQQQAIAEAQDTAGGQDAGGRRTPVETFAADAEIVRDASAPPDNDSPRVARKAQVNESFTEFTAAQEDSEERPQAEASARPPKPAVPPSARTAASRVAAADSGSPGTAPISFWALPQDVRDSLPDLHVTVLVYAEEPSERFVLIGGKRLVEKEQVDQGVVLEEIRREGAVFRYRNYLFLVES